MRYQSSNSSMPRPSTASMSIRVSSCRVLELSKATSCCQSATATDLSVHLDARLPILRCWALPVASICSRCSGGNLKKKTTKGTETRECFINKHRLNQTVCLQLFAYSPYVPLHLSDYQQLSMTGLPFSLCPDRVSIEATDTNKEPTPPLPA